MDRERKLIMALILLAAVVAVTVVATAMFTSSAASAGNMIAAGALSVDTAENGAAVLTAAGLGPGRSTSGTVMVSNTGSSAGTFTLSAMKLQTTPADDVSLLSTGLLLLVQNITSPATPIVLFSGKLNGVGRLALGRWLAGATHVYRFTLTFPRTLVVANYQHVKTHVIFIWSAAS